MDEKGVAVKLDQLGPNTGQLILVVDFSSKAVSLIEIAPKRQAGSKVLVWEVQDYTKVAN